MIVAEYPCGFTVKSKFTDRVGMDVTLENSTWLTVLMRNAHLNYCGCSDRLAVPTLRPATPEEEAEE